MHWGESLGSHSELKSLLVVINGHRVEKTQVLLAKASSQPI